MCNNTLVVTYSKGDPLISGLSKLHADLTGPQTQSLSDPRLLLLVNLIQMINTSICFKNALEIVRDLRNAIVDICSEEWTNMGLSKIVP